MPTNLTLTRVTGHLTALGLICAQKFSKINCALLLPKFRAQRLFSFYRRRGDSRYFVLDTPFLIW